MSHHDLPTAPATVLAVALAARRDGLLLLLLQWVVVAWTWERGTLWALGGGFLAALLFTLLSALLRQGERAWTTLAATSLAFDLGGWPGPQRWTWLFLPLSAFASAMLVARAGWLALGSPFLAAFLFLLSLAWQLWLYFWSAPPPTTG